jgi:hypothetical protein
MATAPAADGRGNGSWHCESERCDWDIAPLIRQDDPAAQEYAVAADGTLIRRSGAGNEAAVTAASIPPLSGGPDVHGSTAAHVITIAGSADADLRYAPGLAKAGSQHAWRHRIAS